MSTMLTRLVALGVVAAVPSLAQAGRLGPEEGYAVNYCAHGNCAGGRPEFVFHGGAPHLDEAFSLTATFDPEGQPAGSEIEIDRPVNVPEPGTLALLGLGLAGLGFASRRRN